MKKKKPKKSPAKSSSKSPSPAKPKLPPPKSISPPTKSATPPLPEDSSDGSDAQISCSTAAVAHLSKNASDLPLVATELTLNETVIVATPTDPISDCDMAHEVDTELSHAAPLSAVSDSRDPQTTVVILPELSSAAPLVTNDSSNLAAADAKLIPLSSQSVPVPVSDVIVVVEAPSPGPQAADLQVPGAPQSEQIKEVRLADSEVKEPAENKGTTESLPKQSSKSVPVDDWCARTKGVGKRLSKKGEAFILPSGEACIKIPNSVIEKNRKSWEPFVLGQFYSDPPSQGTLHNIVNGIWSKHYRDIAVSKMEGFAFLFRIPNAATRHRVITQGLWQIEGQTMFVDKWEPGVIPAKPELTSAPIWLELRNVPFQFFNEDGLERIAGLVGEPKFLHPATANKSNLEVAKVFTVIDPRKPLPEAVNVQFDSGDISRVLVSSPWMPPVCGFCKEVGHITKRCPTAPKACSYCNSLSHAPAKCPKKPHQEPPKKKTRRGRSKEKQQWRVVDTPKVAQNPIIPSSPKAAEEQMHTEIAHDPKLGTHNDKVRGGTSGSSSLNQAARPSSASGNSKSSQSDVQPDSSDVESSDSELEEGEFSQHEPDFELVRNRKKFSGLKGSRGKGPKLN